MRQLAKQVVSDCLKINGYKPGDVWQLRQLAKQVVSDCLKVNGYIPGDVCVGGPASLDRAEKDDEEDSSVLPSVQAKQMRRRMQKRVGIIPQKNKCCLVSACRGLGIKVPYAQDGPFWVLKDGSEMLRPFGYGINPEARLCTTSPGRWLICRDGHCTALHRKGEGDTWIIDGADRKQVADCELDKCVKGAAIYRVPVVDVAYNLEIVIPIVVCLCQRFSL